MVADALSRIRVDEIRTPIVKEKDLNELQIFSTTRAQARKQKENEDRLKEDFRNHSENKNHEIEEPNIMLAIDEIDVKGIPMIHTQKLENALGLFYIICVHHKYIYC